MKYTWIKTLSALLIFGIAFGYIEGSVAHYLRMHFYPNGFIDFSVHAIDQRSLFIEMVREACTLIVIGIAAILSARSPMCRIANYVFIFGVWDISYYGALYLFEGWPSSLFTWDVLFLIPSAWYAPVIAPISISFVGIIGAVLLNVIEQRNGRIRLPYPSLCFIVAAIVSWLFSFLGYGSSLAFPSRYHWCAFILGMLFTSGAFVLIAAKNRASLK